jgi:hypothetical protein
VKRRSVRPLFAAWIAYWLIAGVVKLGPPLLAIWRAGRTTDANAGGVSLSVSHVIWKLVVTDHGQTTWSGTSHVWIIVAWIALVPLVMTVGWFLRAKSDTPLRESA